MLFVFLAGRDRGLGGLARVRRDGGGGIALMFAGLVLVSAPAAFRSAMAGAG